MGVWLLFKGRDTGGAALRSGDLGGHPLHGHVPGWGSYPRGDKADGTDPAEDNGRDVEMHLGGGGKGGGGFIDDRVISRVAPEHGRTVYHYAVTVIPVLWVGEGSWGASRYVVVGTGRN